MQFGDGMNIGEIKSSGAGTVTSRGRRSRIDLLEPIETQARQLMLDVEALGAHPMLTDVVNAVHVVREKLADWVDAGKPGSPPAPVIAPVGPNGEDLED